MPYSIVHFELWLKKKTHFPYYQDFLQFLAGSIFVDVSSFLDVAYQIDRSVTHYYENDTYNDVMFAKSFAQTELGSLSTFKLWYYYHLLADQVWRDSVFIQKCYACSEKEWIYQFSRKLYSNRDLQELKDNSFVTQVIDDLYALKLKKEDLPLIFHHIDITTLQRHFYEILDYMLEKRIFYKKSERKDFFVYQKGELIVHDKQILENLEQIFPHTEYIQLKTVAEDMFCEVEKYLLLS